MTGLGQWAKRWANKWGIRTAFAMLAVLWIALMAATWAQAAHAADQTPDEFNFNWLDPDKKIYVLQNRKYTKAEHAFFSVSGGLGLSNPNRDVFTLEGRGEYFVSESWGIQAFYRKSFNSVSNNYNQLLNASATTGVLPLVREITGEFGGMVEWVPWYAKINVFNNILYFDWYFSAGVGAISSNLVYQQNKNASPTSTASNLWGVYWGTGHIYHFTQSFIVRADLLGSYYRAPSLGTTGDQVTYPNYSFALGIGVKL
jgi:outer membrane beta-barrel protein